MILGDHKIKLLGMAETLRISKEYVRHNIQEDFESSVHIGAKGRINTITKQHALGFEFLTLKPHSLNLTSATSSCSQILRWSHERQSLKYILKQKTNRNIKIVIRLQPMLNSKIKFSTKNFVLSKNWRTFQSLYDGTSGTAI